MSVCRVCLSSESELSALFAQNRRLAKLLMSCASITVLEGDGLPTHICSGCSERASSANEFRRLCENSDKTLRHQLHTSNDSSILLEEKNDSVDQFLAFTCALCHQCFSSSEQLVDHVLQVHAPNYENQTFTCNLCEMKYCNEFELKRHLVSHKEFSVNGKVNVCPICKQEFSKHRHLLEHMEFHTSKSRHKCSICDCYFTTNAQLRIHINEKHNDKNQTVIKNEIEELTVKVELIDSDSNMFLEDFSSDICDSDMKSIHFSSNSNKYFDDKKEFLRNRNDVKESRNDLRLSLKRKKKPKKLKTKLKKKDKSSHRNVNDSFDESHSQDVFKSPNKEHFVEVLPSNYSCEMCSENFSELELLNEHKKQHSKSFLCSICGKEYCKQKSLDRHINSHSKKAKKQTYECTVCGKVMYHSNNLLVHMRTHENKNEPPLTQEKVPDKNLILCTMCGKSCSSRSNLAVHMRRHLGVMTCVCKVCGKGYPRTTDLTLHMRKHTGEKPFSCNVCSKSFARSDKLAIHMRIHTGEKPYVCQICNRGFAQSNDLATHKRRNNCSQNIPNQSVKKILTNNKNVINNEHQVHIPIRNVALNLPSQDSIVDLKQFLKGNQNQAIDEYNSIINQNSNSESSNADNNYSNDNLFVVELNPSDLAKNMYNQVMEDINKLKSDVNSRIQKAFIQDVSNLGNFLGSINKPYARVTDFVKTDPVTKTMSDLVKRNFVTSDILMQKVLEFPNVNNTIIIPKMEPKIEPTL